MVVLLNIFLCTWLKSWQFIQCKTLKFIFILLEHIRKRTSNWVNVGTMFSPISPNQNLNLVWINWHSCLISSKNNFLQHLWRLMLWRRFRDIPRWFFLFDINIFKRGSNSLFLCSRMCPYNRMTHTSVLSSRSMVTPASAIIPLCWKLLAQMNPSKKEVEIIIR